MSAEPEPEPALAQEAANGVTTLAVAMEEKPTTMTIPLERQRIVLQGWIDRQMLHSPSTKAYKELGERVAKLQQKYDKDCGAYRGRQLMQPALREAAMKKRAATVKAKHEAMVGDIVKRVTDALGADAAGKKKAAAAVADLFESAEKAEPKKKKQKAKVAVEEDSE